ncbi:hypothetical protein BDB00DRAFT_351498 [Zychaea mexicana]|uniref:uncharacterized protein n=1 Tax=Zychaea mexicana TaxID=64656 RepID=UPI0022FE5E65|nr:uncharacterized protein BDB00DRAFT_351498 [Zychaea mexicana]KAI9493942.1 hypothetical protein BDB00DRAFT_351498 [Zychaea mexicana]
MGGFQKEKLDFLMILNRRSLTRLILHCMWDNDNAYVEEYAHKAASRLPNLRFVSQYIHQGNDNGIPNIYQTLPSNLPSGLHLTKLDLSWANYTGELENIQQLIRKSQYLISLTLNGSTYPYYATMLETIYEHCPVLREFFYTSSIRKVAITEYTPPPSSSTANSGLRKLVIRPPITSKNIYYHRTHAIDEQLKLILRRSHTTLETLDLNFGLFDPTGGYTLLDTLANLGAPNLQCLVIDASLCYPGVRSRQISDMISACPFLQVVDITGNFFWHKRIFDTLANNTTELRKLSIRVNDTSPPQQQYQDLEEDTVIPAAFLLATVFDKALYLREFSFGHALDHGFESTLAVDIASHLYRSRSIRQIDYGKVIIRSSETLVSILEQFTRAPIHKVRLRVEFELTKEEFEALAAVKTLAHLELKSCQEGLGESTIHSLFEEWQTQRSLFVRIERIDSFAMWEGYKLDKTVYVKCVRQG